MLEKVNHLADAGFMDFRRINSADSGTSLCYVSGGTHKFTKAGKPYITLFLRDINGNVIPGYIFDVANFKQAGIELTQVIHQVVRVTWDENFLSGIGLTLILNRVLIEPNITSEQLGFFVGSIKDVEQKYNQLNEFFHTELGVKVTQPYTMCTVTNMEYSQGKVGGIVEHYDKMKNIILTYRDQMTTEEFRLLVATFLIFVFCHNNYVVAENKGEADINLVTALTAGIAQTSSKLNVPAGINEVVHCFFGYTPKDLFVRMVNNISADILRADRELAMYRTLPISREGNAGYGIIRRYKDEEIKQGC